jgi:NAD(P)-dependent dehydrogenase (short-subunit alcohol dehydrogenase family)
LKIEQGAIVTAHYNSNSKSLEPLLANSSKVQAIKADLRVEEDVVKLFSSAQHTFGSVQIIIVNHAISVVKDDYLWEMSLDRWRTTIDTNLTSSFLVTREYLKQLKTASSQSKEKAAIIFIGSTAGKYGQLSPASPSPRPIVAIKSSTNLFIFCRRGWTRRLCSFQKWYAYYR